MNTFDYEIANPNASSLMQSLRAFGYDISTAVADLIDNSITAKAHNIAIQFEWNNGSPWNPWHLVRHRRTDVAFPVS